MALKLPYTQTDDRQFNQYQISLAQSLAPIITGPLAKTQLIKGTAILSTGTTIYHSLGYALTGWIITRKYGSGDVWDVQNTNTKPAESLLLVSSGNVTVDILVF